MDYWHMIRELVKQFMKFGVVGVAAFVIDYGLLVALTELIGLNYLLSATISYVIATVFNYFASMRWVFTHREGASRLREFVIFVLGSFVGLAINDLCMWVGVELLGIHYIVCKLFATAVVAIWNFMTRKLLLDAK